MRRGGDAWRWSRRIAPYVIGAVGVTVITVVIGVTRSVLDVPALTIAYLLLVLWLGARHGWPAAVMTAVLAFAVYAWFFVPETGTIYAIALRDGVDLILLLLFALAGGRLTASMAERVAGESAIARESSTLYDLAVAALREPWRSSALPLLCRRAAEVGGVAAMTIVECGPGGAVVVAGEALREDQIEQARRAFEQRADVGARLSNGELIPAGPPTRDRHAYVVLSSGVAVLGLPGGGLADVDRRLLAALMGLAGLLLDRRRWAAAMEEERARIARDIHDDTLQTLGSMVLRLDLLREQAPDSPMRDEIDQLLRLARDSSDRLRTLVFELRADVLELGLEAAIRVAVRDQSLQAGIEHEVTVRTAAEPRVEVALALYRITQEALTNVRRHARAGRVSVSLAEERDELVLRVADDGIGFDPSSVATSATGVGGRAGHLGLRSMAERAQLVGGQLDVGSAPGRGTVVEARVPSDAEPPPHPPHPPRE